MIRDCLIFNNEEMGKKEKKKALLILIGGRQMPNFLTAQSLHPDVILPIASPEGLKDSWEKIKPALNRLNLSVAEPKEVDAFDLNEIKEKCREAFADFPDYEWVFNITCGTSVMSIGAFEIAKEKGISAWYLDTNTRRVAVLCGQSPETDPYFVKIPDYLLSYGRRVGKSGINNPTESLKNYTRKLASDASATTDFQHALAKAVQGKNVLKANNLELEIETPAEPVRSLFYAAQQTGLLQNLREVDSAKLKFTLPDYEKYAFLNGGWLEFYVWLVANDLNKFDDTAYSLTIPTDGDQKEIDFALSYSGALLIAECKTDAKPFKTKYLEKLVSVSSLIGANFVGKIFITNQFPDDSNSAVKDFFNQAKARQIVVVTGKELKDLGEILIKEAGVGGKRPTYNRG
jgi:hypothetical protein